MTGMGGGSLMTPMLILIFGFDPKTAVGTDILHGAVFKSFGAWRHRSSATCTCRLRSGCSSARRRSRSSACRSRTRSRMRRQSTMGRVVGGALIVGGIGFAEDVREGHASDGDLHLSTRDKV